MFAASIQNTRHRAVDDGLLDVFRNSRTVGHDDVSETGLDWIPRGGSPELDSRKLLFHTECTGWKTPCIGGNRKDISTPETLQRVSDAV